MDTAPTFDLVDSGWIPVVARGRPMAETVGLARALLEAHEFSEIQDASPLVTAALYRLLLAVLHTALDGPNTVDEWAALWEAGRFPADVLTDYLGRWRDRFDLFHPVHPFYQRADLEAEYALQTNLLVHDYPAASGAVLFSHVFHDAVPTLSYAQAARALVATQVYAVGGLHSYRKGEDPKVYKSADAGPAFKGATMLVRGASLFETLMLNLVRYDPSSELPFRTVGDDRPAWERDIPTEAADIRPNGYRHLLTWQSRRIRLISGQRADGSPGIVGVVRMKGNQFPDDWDNHDKEQFIAWKQREGAKGEDPVWQPVGIDSDRALWRDSAVLFGAAGVSQDHAPGSFVWLAELRAEGVLPDRFAIADLDAIGLDADKSKILAWRHERLVLPLDVLHEEKAWTEVAAAIDLAEAAGRIVRWVGREFATNLLSPESDIGGRSPDKDAVGNLARRLGLERTFWPLLERPFAELLQRLPADVGVDDYGNRVYGATSRPFWLDAVREAASMTVARLDGTSGEAARTLKARAAAERLFRFQLAKIARDYAPRDVNGGNDGERSRVSPA
jgi:CRISPR system Cascade subunit CasA